MTRILLAVNDTPAGLAAARTAIRWAAESNSPVRAVHVLPEGAPVPAGGRPAGVERDDRQAHGPSAVLRYVAGLGQHAGVTVETVALTGQPATAILEQASAWQADVIVLGRSGVRQVGRPFVGSQVLHVLEFAEVPVVVVPAP